MNDGLFQSELTAVIQPRVLLKPESWLSKIEFINHLILFNNILITVLSEKEGGKTSFATLLQENLDPQIKLLPLSVKVPCSREAIISDIASQFHLKHDENTDVSSLVTQINERRAHVLLLIDNAQHVPETFIKEVLLAIKNQDDFNFFHVCLISDYSLVAALNGLTSSFFEGLVHNIEVGALNEQETRTYVLQRAMAGHLINKPLSETQQKQLYQLTRGNIAKINGSLEPFIFNCSSKKQSNKMDLLKKISFPVGAAAISGLSCLFLVKAFYVEPSSAVNPVAIQAHHPQIKPAEPEVLLSQIASWQDSSTRELVDHSLAQKQNLDILSQTWDGGLLAIADKATQTAREKTNKRILAKTKKRHRKLVSAPVVNGEKLYTIQLVASPYKIDMKRYIQSNKMINGSARLHYYTENKITWYVLTVGEYSSMTEANKELGKLPSSLMKLDPWVRPISSLG